MIFIFHIIYILVSIILKIIPFDVLLFPMNFIDRNLNVLFANKINNTYIIYKKVLYII
jgi:hypothetical protein